MVQRAGIAKTPDAVNRVVPQPSGSGAGAMADTMDALGREALRLNERLQPLANEHAKDQAGKAALAGNFGQKRLLVEEDAAYNNAIESAYHAKMSTDVEETISALVRDHPIGEPVETLNAKIDAAKRAYIQTAPSAYALSTGQKWDEVGTRASISVADAQKANAIKTAAQDIDERMQVIENRLSNATDLSAPDVVALLADHDALAAQLTNPLYGIAKEKITSRQSFVRDKIIMRGLVNQADGIYEKDGLDASREFLFGVRQRTDLSLPDSQRDAIVSEAWSNIRFKDAERKAAAAQAKAEARANMAMYKQELSGRMQDAILAFERGIVFDDAPKPDEIERVFGPAKAALYEQAMGGAPLMAELKTATAPELTAILNEPKPDPSKAGFKESIKMYDQRQKAAARLLKDRKDDPMAAHIESGLIDKGDIQAALQDDASMRIFLRTRGIAAMQAGADYGTKPNPLTKAEAGALSNWLESVDGKSRTQFLQNASRAFGKDGGAAYRALVRQLKPGSAAFTQGGMLLSLDGAKVGNYDASKAAEIIIAGDALLNPSKADKEQSGRAPFAMPKDDEIGRIWQKNIGTAYAGLGGAEPMAYQTFKAAYAGLAADAGVFSGEMDQKIAKDAAKIATGGVGKWGERDVLLPWGMTESDFQSRIARGWPNIVAKFPTLKGTDAADWDLIAVGDGRYKLGRGNQYARSADGREITMTVRR